jgi:urease gamma subunit
MINVRATVKGEPDTFPFTMDFQYPSSSDERIFYESVQIIKEKSKRKLKLNVNESLVLFCAYIVRSLREHRSTQTIEDCGSKILSADEVMIGVPETLRRITFDALVDNLPGTKIILDQPIPLTNLV